MPKPVLVVGLTFAGLALFALLCGWMVFQASRVGDGWGGLGPILPYVIGGLLGVGVLTGVLIWLAFYSARHGYDYRFGPDEP